MQNVKFYPGDELVLIHRRRTLIKEDGVDKEVHTDTEVSVVGVPEEFKCGKGTCAPEYVADDKNESADKRYLVIRLEMLR